ncbi:MAG: L,D-transpeptidase family protein [Alphaproteobacteria bacterium]
MSILSRLAMACLVGVSVLVASGPAEARVIASRAVGAFYKDQGISPVWADAKDFDGLLAALEGLSAHGLNPAEYHLNDLKAMATDAAERDRLATDAWFLAATHMLHGKVNPVSVEPTWTVAGRSRDLSPVLRAALANDSVADSLEALAPMQSEYAGLKRALSRLRGAAVDQPIILTAGQTIRPGETGPRVRELRARLRQLDVLGDAGDGPADIFDEATDIAVQTFQYQHGLEVDGQVGPRTLAALNRGNGDLIDRLRVNLERWRWLPDTLGTQHVRVNIPGFSVAAWAEGKHVRTHQAIVGRLYRQTPVFSDEINHIVFNPWWNAPESIARADKLPLFKRDPGAVDRLGFQILDRTGKVVNPASIRWSNYTARSMPYRMRQKPGPNNALGQVKIMFPNKHAVYLHDTPDQGLFSRHVRAFSSGCIRTEHPLELSAWLLQQVAGWDQARIDAVVDSGKETRVNLAAPVPVHILYFTALDEGPAGIRYLDDIYDRDAPVLTALDSKPDQ